MITPNNEDLILLALTENWTKDPRSNVKIDMYVLKTTFLETIAKEGLICHNETKRNLIISC